jgi:hypothetical protein
MDFRGTECEPHHPVEAIQQFPGQTCVSRFRRYHQSHRQRQPSNPRSPRLESRHRGRVIDRLPRPPPLRRPRSLGTIVPQTISPPHRRPNPRPAIIVSHLPPEHPAAFFTGVRRVQRSPPNQGSRELRAPRHDTSRQRHRAPSAPLGRLAGGYRREHGFVGRLPCIDEARRLANRKRDDRTRRRAADSQELASLNQPS